MIIVGLTGSIGMGKSTVAQMFADDGVPVFDADAAVHALQGPGGSLVPAIEAAFPGTTGATGVDRKLLGTIVFADPAALERLESIVHPAVAALRQSFLQTNRAADIVLFDIPLLFETNGVDQVDTVIVVSAPADVQRARVLARPGMTLERFAAICDRQVADDDKGRRADYVIDTGTSLAQTRAQVREVIACLRQASGSSSAPDA